MTDPIADLLTRIRNAAMRELTQTVAPYSKMKEQILVVLQNEGYIESYTVEGDLKKNLIIKLKYNGNNSVVKTLKKISKPGIRKYVGYREMKPVLNGYGVGIVSTSKGILTDKQARDQKVGGEIICEIW